MFKATDYHLDPLASLLVGVFFLWGVGILEGFPPCWRDADRDVALVDDSPTVSDTSEHTDWMSEMSKSEASLPLRLLPLLPALLPGRLEFFLCSRNKKRSILINNRPSVVSILRQWFDVFYSPPIVCARAFSTAALIKVPSSPDWKPLPDKYPGRRNLLPWTPALYKRHKYLNL